MIDTVLAGTPLHALKARSDSEAALNAASVQDARRTIADRMEFIDRLEREGYKLRGIVGHFAILRRTR